MLEGQGLAVHRDREDRVESVVCQGLEGRARRVSVDAAREDHVGPRGRARGAQDVANRHAPPLRGADEVAADLVRNARQGDGVFVQPHPDQVIERQF